MFRLSRSILKTVTASRFPTVPQNQIKASSIRAFSVSSLSKSQGQVDPELCHALNKEHDFERQSRGENDNSQVLEEFKKRGTFSVIDKEGSKEVKLQRKFGNEEITVIFNTDSLSEAEETVEEEESESTPSFPVNLVVLVSKKEGSKDLGTMECSVTLEGESFFIDNVSFDQSSNLMADETAEADWQRRAMFGGPVFGELDEGLQETFHQYLEERGFDDALSDFIVNYIEFKEQKEYMRWLDNVSKFVAK